MAQLPGFVHDWQQESVIGRSAGQVIDTVYSFWNEHDVAELTGRCEVKPIEVAGHALTVMSEIGKEC